MEYIKNNINNYIINKNVPNLLLYGSAMKQKKDICNYFIKNVYKNKENINKYVLNINCLSTNGIKLIKEYIKLFSMQIINTNEDIYFKTIILNNSDYLTFDSQYSLRRTIEQFSNNTRFILLCENKNKLLGPICSRFVNIYVYEPNNQKIQYNKLFSNNKYSIINKFIKKYNNILTEKDTNILYNLYLLSNEIYMSNIFTYEILAKFKKNINYYTIKNLIEFTCNNYRNETLSIFYLLNFFRNNHKIQIYELY